MLQPIAQLGRAPALGAGGPSFKSRLADFGGLRDFMPWSIVADTMENFVTFISAFIAPKLVGGLLLVGGAIATLWRTGTWQLFMWWFVVMPWGKALRVRLGKDIEEFGPGLHFRIPYIHIIYHQSVRLRFSPLQLQTVSTKDGHTISYAGVIGYCVADLRKLYDTMQHPENTISSIAQTAVANYLFSHPLTECAPEVVQDEAERAIDLSQYGLGCVSLRITTYARVRTYRLLMDKMDHAWEGELTTQYGDSGTPHLGRNG